MNLVDKAYQFAKERHEGHLRRDGRPYFEAHLVPVWKIVKYWGLDEITQAAAYLHDGIEDGKMTAEEINEEFGGEVTSVVLTLTNTFDTYTEFLFEIKDRWNHWVNVGDDEFGQRAFEAKKADILANYYDCITGEPAAFKKKLKMKYELGYAFLYGGRIWQNPTLLKMEEILNG